MEGGGRWWEVEGPLQAGRTGQGVAQKKGEGGNDSRTRGLVSWLSELSLICRSGGGITEGAAACTRGLGVSPVPETE